MQLNDDRILDAYYGHFGTTETQYKARERVHWIMKRVQGERVLDIGCSQGLVPILLGRAGHGVLGLELRPDAVAFARGELEKEPASVRKLVQFEEGDAFQLERIRPNERFTTAILGEVIEHVAQPNTLLEAAASALEPNGRLVITTPFGLHPDPDHKQLFYAASFVDVLPSKLSVAELEVAHGYLCCVAVNDGAGRRPTAEELLRLDEKHFRAVEEATYFLRQQDRANVKRLTDENHKLKADLQEVQQLRAVLGAFSTPAPKSDVTELVATVTRVLRSRTVETDLAKEKCARAVDEAAELRRKLEKEKRELTEAMSSLRAEAAVLREQLVRKDTVIVHKDQSIVEKKKLIEELRPKPVLSRVARWLVGNEGLQTNGGGGVARPRKGNGAQIAKSNGTNAVPARASSQGKKLQGPEAWLHTPRVEPLPITIASVLDDFSWQNLRHDANLYKLPSKSWREALEAQRPHMLLVESAWNGNDGDWKYKITYKTAKADNPLFAALEYCKAQGIPTVFWNKEDPPNYDQFIDAARRFDYVFTTDQNCVPKYKVDAPNSIIGVLPFAAQPIIQNPVNINRFEKLGDVCFAGAWYPRHPERFEDLRLMLEASKDYQTVIYDRYLHHPEHEKYKFPPEFEKYVKGGLSFEEMLVKYRQFRVFLNVNSVKDSPTMFSRRVLEILACGTPVVSGHAAGIEHFFGQDIVPMCRTQEEAKAALDMLLRDPVARDRAVLRGQREIFGKHTYRQRLKQICDTVGIPLAGTEDHVSVITATIRKAFVDNFLANFARQTIPLKELIVVVNEGTELTADYVRERADAMNVPNVRVLTAPRSMTLGACLNLGIENANGSIFAKMDDDDYYGEHYLEDSLQALHYSGADCVGKECYLTYSKGHDRTFRQMPGRQHRLTKFVIGTTLVAKRAIYPQVAFGDKRVGEDTEFLQRLASAGKTLYSHSEYNYVKYYAADVSHHTWQVSAAEYLKNSEGFCDGFVPEKCCF